MLDSPVFQLILVALATAVVRLLLFKPAPPPTAAGAPLMALGIFIIAALTRLPGDTALVSRLLALELLVLWVYVAVTLSVTLARGRLRAHSRDVLGSFVMGTWVAGTAVVARALADVLREWLALASSLWVLATALWLWYLRFVISGYWRLWREPAGKEANGRLLLPTVATQSLVVTAETLWPGAIPAWLDAGLVLLGCLFYVLGLALIARRYLRWRAWSLSDDWHNTNCILHGAISITGLASVASSSLPQLFSIVLWLLAAAVFVLVEALEIARCWLRVERYGWLRGALTYDVTQWSRNFTLGMFYAFTLLFHERLLPVAGAGWSWLGPLQELVLGAGQYVVFALLVLEVALFLASGTLSKATEDLGEAIEARRRWRY